MKIKVGELRRIIREVAGAAGKSTSELAAALDELAATWNEWSSMEAKGDIPGTSGYSGAKLMSGVRVILGDAAAVRWPNASELAADPEAQEYAAAVEALPWPTDDVSVRAALVQPWVSSTRDAAVAAVLGRAGLEVPVPRVRLAPSPFAGHGGGWKAVVLGGLSYAERVAADAAVEDEENRMRRPTARGKR
jgi:hypothetical protein